MLNRILWQTLLVSPCVLGVSASISPSLAATPTNPETEVMKSLESPSVDGNIRPLQIAELVTEDTIFKINTDATNVNLPINSVEAAELKNQPEVTTSLETQSIEKNIAPLQLSSWEISQTNPSNTQTNTDINFPSLNTPVESNTNTTDTPVESNTNTTDTPVESNTSEPMTVSNSNRWHFKFQPYLYVPIKIYGDTTLKRGDGNWENNNDSNIDSNGNIDIDFTEIKTIIDEKLNFVFMGKFEAWTPNYRLGIISNVDYLSLSTEASFNRPVRNSSLEEYVPTDLNANLDTTIWSTYLAASYRFYDPKKVNPQGVSSEFDLGFLVFDVFGGMDISGVSNDLELKTNLGGYRNFDRSTTIVSPMLGAGVRFNVLPDFAVVTGGKFAGFGISGLTKWSLYSGIDWMFTKNISLGAGYRFQYMDYNQDVGFKEEDFGLTLNNNGPYLDFSFRF